jgi:hypothetical protein
MVAKATNEGRASPVVHKSPSKDVYEPWEMTEKESELTLKCVKLIQGRIPSKVGALTSFTLLYCKPKNMTKMGVSLYIRHLLTVAKFNYIHIANCSVRASWNTISSHFLFFILHC